jgi:hypothetical protein
MGNHAGWNDIPSLFEIMTIPEFDTDSAPDTVIESEALDALEYFPDGTFQAIFVNQQAESKLEEAWKLLHETGTLYLQLNQSKAHQGWTEESFRSLLEASTRPGDWVLDYGAHHGDLGVAAFQMDRRFVLIEQDPEAQKVIRDRFQDEEMSGVEYHTRLNRSRVPTSKQPEPNAPQK